MYYLYWKIYTNILLEKELNEKINEIENIFNKKIKLFSSKPYWKINKLNEVILEIDLDCKNFSLAVVQTLKLSSLLGNNWEVSNFTDHVEKNLEGIRDKKRDGDFKIKGLEWSQFILSQESIF